MPAWDLVFRPHKDVSILYALGDEATGRRVAGSLRSGWHAPPRPPTDEGPGMPWDPGQPLATTGSSMA
jgi:hypothetical protein